MIQKAKLLRRGTFGKSQDVVYRCGKKFTYPYLIAPLLFALSVSASAQKILTLDEAIGNALEKNYDIILSRNDSAVAAIDYSYRDAVFLRRLNATAGINWNNNAQKQTLADGSKRDKSGIKSNNVTSQVALNWTLF